MHQFCDENKTISNPAKLLRGYMLATGKTDAKQIAEDLGIPLRTIQRLKLECAIYGVSESANDANSAIYGVSDRIKSANDAISGVYQPATLAPADITTRATNELPSEVLLPRFIDSPLSDPQAVFEAVELVTPLVETAIVAKPTSRPRGTRLPDAWDLPADWRMWARTNFPFASPEQIDDQAAQFHDYWIAKPGAMAAKLNWQATWRNWCRKGLSAAGRVRKPQYTGVYDKPPLESSSAVLARMVAEGAFQ